MAIQKIREMVVKEMQCVAASSTSGKVVTDENSAAFLLLNLAKKLDALLLGSVKKVACET